MPLAAWTSRLRRTIAALSRRQARRDDFVRLGLARLEDRVVLDGAAVVADLQPGSGSSNPAGLTEFNGSYYFTADGTNAAGQSVGRELFRLNADGTVALVADINSGTAGSDPGDFTLFDPNGSARLLFAATGPQGRELYQLGTNGNVTLVFDINPGVASSDPVMLTEFSGKLYFTAFTSATGREAYVVNNGGNVSLIADLNPGSASSDPSALYQFGGNLYFSAEVAGSRFLFREAPSGTSDPVLVNLGTGVTDPRDFVTFNNRMLFSALDPADGRELFAMSISGGGKETVAKVANLDNTSADSSPEDFFAFGQNLYFSATGANGRELFRLNTAGNITQLDLEAGSASSSPSGFVEFQGDMYFAATVGGQRGLWRLDTSTSALAAVAVPLPAGVELPQEAVFYALADELFFAADGPAGRELYRMNTDRVVSLAADVNFGPSGSDPAEVILFGGKIYFVATEASVGRELFVLRRDPSSIRIDDGKLIFNDDAGDKDNRLVISSTGTHLVIVDQNGHTITILTAIAGATGEGTNQVVIPLASLAGVTALDIFTQGGNDSATFDLSANADSILAQFVSSTYDGGPNTAVGDKLRFVGDGTTNSAYTPDASTTGSGIVVVSSSAQTLSFSFLAIEPVDFTGMAEAKIVTPTTATGADVLTMAAGVDSLHGLVAALIVSGTVGGTAIESGYFFGNQSVVIATGAGVDLVTVTGATNLHDNTELKIDTGSLAQDAVQIAGNVTLAGQLQINTGMLTVQATVLLGGPAALTTAADTVFSSSGQLFAPQVTITAGGAIALADGALINAGSGTIGLTAGGDITLGRLVTTNSTSAAIVLTSLSGSIFDGGDSGGPNIVAEGLGAVVTITAAQGVGTSSSPLDLAVRNLVVTSGGNQYLNELDNLSSLDLDAGNANIHLTAGGTIQDGDAGVDIVAGQLIFAAASAGTSSQPLQTQLASLIASVSAGDLHLTESDGLTVISAAAPAGNISLRSLVGNLVIQSVQAQGLVTLVAQSGAILSGAAGTNVTATNLELSAATGIGTAAALLAMQVQRLEGSGGSGGLFVSNQGNLQVGGISPSLLGLTGLAAINSDIVVTVIGTLTTVESTSTTAGGDVDLSATGDIVIQAPITSQAGSIDLEAQQALRVETTSISSVSGPISLLAGGAIALADGALIDAGSGTIGLTAGGNITLGRLVTTNSTSAAIVLTSLSGSIFDGGDSGGPNVVAEGAGAVVTITAAQGVGTAASPLDLAVRNLVVTSGGNQYLNELDSLSSLDLDAGNANIHLTAGGSIQDGDGAVDIAANQLVLSAASAGTAAQPLQTQLASLVASVSAGDLHLAESDGLTVISAAAPAGNISLKSLTGNLVIQSVQAQGLVTLVAQSGAIRSGAAGTNVTATNLEMAATAGIGTAAVPLATQVQRLEGSGGSGGLFVSNQGNLQVGGISPSLLGLTGLAAINSDIVVTVIGTLTTVESTSTTAGGDVDLSATNDIVIQAPITSQAGAIDLEAQQDLRVENTNIDSVSGSISLVAHDGGIIVSGAAVNSASGNITLQGQGGADGDHGILLTDSSVGQFGSGNVLLAGQGTGGLADIAWDTLTIAKSGGTYTFQDTVQGNKLIVLPGNYQVVFLDGGIITQAVDFQNTGGVVLGNADGDTITFTGGITSTAGPTTIQGTLITGGTPITLGSTTLVSTVTLLTSGGNVMIGQISGGGVPLAINAGSGDVTLADPGNVIGDLTITADELTLFENDHITQAGPWTTTGLTTLNSGSFAIILTNPGNQLGPLDLSGASITVVEGGDTELTSVDWSGLLAIDTSGSLLVSGLISGNGTAQLTADGNITFAPGGSLVASGGSADVTLTAGGAIALADGALINAGSGTIGLTAGGDITLGRLVTTNSTSSAIVLTSLSGSIFDGGDSGGPNIVAEGSGAVVTITAAQGVGTSSSPLDLAVRNLVVTSGGNQYLNELDSLSSLDLDAGSANIQLTAGGTIQDGDGAVDIAANQLVLSAASAGTAAQPLQTQLASLTASVSAGDLHLTESDGLTVISAAAPAGNISLKSLTGNLVIQSVQAQGLVTLVAQSGAILSGAGGTIITATNLEMAATAGIGSAVVPLATQVQRMEGSGGSGGLFVANQGNLQVGGISPSLLGLTGLATINSDIVVTVIGTLTTVESTSTTASGDIDLSATGDIVIQAPITSQAGAIDLEAQQDLRVETTSISSVSGPISLLAGGAIALTDGALIDAGSGTIGLTAGGNITLGRLVTTNGTSSAIVLTSLSGSIFDGGDSGGPNIVAEGLGAVVTITAAQGVGTAASPLDLAVRNLVVTSGGNQYLNELDSLSSLDLDAGSANIQLMAGGTIQDGDGAVDIAANQLVFSAASAGTAAQPLQTQLASLTASVSAGDLHLTESDGLTVISAAAPAGNISLRSLAGNLVIQSVQAQGLVTLVAQSGAILSGAAGTNVTATNLELSAATGIGTAAALLATQVQRLEGSGGSGGLFVSNQGNLQVGGISPSLLGLTGLATINSPIVLTVNGTLTTIEAISATGAGSIDLFAASDLIVQAPITSQAGSIDLEAQQALRVETTSISSVSGPISLLAGGAMALADGALINAGSGTIGLTAGGNITLGRLMTTNGTASAVSITSLTGSIVDGGDSGGPNIVAEGLGAVVTITAAQGVGTSSSPLDLAVRNLVVTSGGNQYLNELDSLSSLDLDAGSANIHLTAGGQVNDSDSAVDIKAGGMAIVAEGAGSLSNPLQANLARLEAEVGAGGLVLVDAGGLELGGVTDSIKGVHSNDGPLKITAGGFLLISEAVGASGSGSIQLIAAADISLAARIGSESGNISLLAAGDILAGAGSGIDTLEGTILLRADQDNLGGGTIHFAGDIDVGFGQVIFHFSDADGQLSGSIQGRGGLVKQGTGTLTLTQTSINTYTGTTQLLGGTLRVNGTIGSAGPAGTLSLAGGTTLTGGGDINAPIFSVETTARIVSTGDLQLGDGSADGFDFAGTFLIGGGDQVTLRDADLARLGILTMIQGGGHLTALGGVEVGNHERLSGSGAVSGNIVVLAGGMVSPGASPGVVSTLRGDVVLFADAIYLAEIDGTRAGAQYDQINVQGTVDVSGAVLSISGGRFRPPTGTVFTLIANDDAGGVVDRVSGEFRGLPEGATIRFGAIEAKISYVGGSGNDITLTVSDLRLIRSLTPGAVALIRDDTGGGGAISLARKAESPPVLFSESARPAAISQGTDARPQALETRAVERLRVFLKVVDEVTKKEEGKEVDLDPRVIDDVLGFFQRYRFPNGRYRIYVQEAGKAPRLIIEIVIRDGRAVTPEVESPALKQEAPAPAQPALEQPAQEQPAPAQEQPARPADPAAARPLARPTRAAAMAAPPGHQDTHGEADADVARQAAGVHRWSSAAAPLAVGLAGAACSSWRERIQQLLSAPDRLPRTRFHRPRVTSPATSPESL